MHLLFTDQLFSPSLIQALGWTLIHSLWQGLLAATIALVILWLTKKSSPLLRYNLLLLVFCIFIVAVIFTFSIEYNTAKLQDADKNIASTLFSNQPFSENIATFTVVEQTKVYLSSFEEFFNTHANIIVAIWFFVFCFQCLRLCSSLGYMYQIRNYKTYTPSSDWQERCRQLKRQLGISKPVYLLESGIAKVPLVVGFFKPLILLPVGLLANLPYNQVESILLHELAHIKRRDYIVNLLQSFLETIFFFNPAILWISSLIKEEREACCDAMAVQHLDSKSDYISALISFQEYAMHSPGYGLAFPGRKNSLLKRVKRIINNENKKLTSMEKTILICGITAITIVSILSSKEAKAQNEVLNPINKSVDKRLDTIPKSKGQNISKTSNGKKSGRTRVTTDVDGQKKTVVLETSEENGREIKAKLHDNRITELSVNGEVIDSKEFEKYEPEVKSIIDRHRAEGEIANQQANQRAIEKTQVNKGHQQNIQREKQLIQKGEIANQQASERINERTQVSKEEQQTIQREKQLIQKNQNDQKLFDDEVKMTFKNSSSDDSHQQIENILELLKRNNIIKGKDGTKFKLNNEELLVNGIRQSAEIQQLLKQKYIYKSGDYYTFSSSRGSTDITVHRE